MVAAVHFITPILNKTRQNMKIIFEFNQVQTFNDQILYGKFLSIKRICIQQVSSCCQVLIWKPQVRLVAQDRVLEVSELMTTLRNAYSRYDLLHMHM